MPGLVPGTHALLAAPKKRRGWPGHQGVYARLRGLCPAMTRRATERAILLSESCPASCRAPTPCLLRPRRGWPGHQGVYARLRGLSPAMTRGEAERAIP